MCFNGDYKKSRRANVITLVAGLLIFVFTAVAYQYINYDNLFLYFLLGVIGFVLAIHSAYNIIYLILDAKSVSKLHAKGEQIVCTVSRKIKYRSAYCFVCVYNNPVDNKTVEFTSCAYTCGSEIADACIGKSVVTYIQHGRYDVYNVEMGDVLTDLYIKTA